MECALGPTPPPSLEEQRQRQRQRSRTAASNLQESPRHRRVAPPLSSSETLNHPALRPINLIPRGSLHTSNRSDENVPPPILVKLHLTFLCLHQLMCIFIAYAPFNS